MCNGTKYTSNDYSLLLSLNVASIVRFVILAISPRVSLAHQQKCIKMKMKCVHHSPSMLDLRWRLPRAFHPNTLLHGHIIAFLGTNVNLPPQRPQLAPAEATA